MKKKKWGGYQRYFPYFLLVAPFLLLLPGINDYIFPGSGLPFSDQELTHFPNALFLKEHLSRGIIPLWNPNLFAGAPFLAHPYSGLFYPPYWLAILFPLPLGINLFLGFHLIIAGLGMKRLLENEGLGVHGALIGALIFSMSPKLFAHIGAGHLFLVVALTLTPWIFATSKSTGQSKRIGLFQPGFFLALIFLVDPRWSFYATVLWVLWVIAHRHGLTIKQKVVEILQQGSMALLISLPAVVLFSEFSLLSTRSQLSPDESLAFSLPWSALIDLIVPRLPAFHEWVVYLGIIPLLLGILSSMGMKRFRRNAFWLGIFALSFVMALGENLPINASLSDFPLLRQLRVPPRALFLATFSIAVLSARLFDSLIRKPESLPLRNVRLLALAMGVSVIAFGYLVFPFDPPRFYFAVLLSLIIFLFAIAVGKYSTQKLKSSTFFGIVSLLIVIDIGLMANSLIEFQPGQDVLAIEQELKTSLLSISDEERIYTPSNSIGQSNAALMDIHMINGVDPLQLSASIDYISEAAGISVNGYSVSFPPFSNSDHEGQHEGAVLDLEKLARLNTKYVLSDFEISQQNLSLVDQFAGQYLYKNEVQMGAAWLIQDGEISKYFAPDRSNPNQIDLELSGPGEIVFSEINYPGWEATVNGKSLIISDYDGLFQSISLVEGVNIIQLRFRPTALNITLPISILTIGYLVVMPKWKRAKP